MRLSTMAGMGGGTGESTDRGAQNRAGEKPSIWEQPEDAKLGWEARKSPGKPTLQKKAPELGDL